MKEPDGKFEEEIRCALRTAGDLVVPAGDGLIKIRERTVYRPRPMAWIFAYAHHLLTLPLLWLRLPASELAATARGHSSLKPRLRSARHWPRLMLGALRTPSLWIRPVLAAGAALALVIGVALAIPGLGRSLGAQLVGGSATSGSSHSPGASQGPGGNPQSSGSPTGIGIGPSGVTGPILGLPWDATMAPSPGPTGTCQGSGQRASVPVPYAPIPVASPPGIGQTAGAGTLTGGAPGSPAMPNQGSAGAMGKTGAGAGAQTTACSHTSKPSSSPSSQPPTSPASTPPTSPSSSPTTSPTSSPTTSPTSSPTTSPTGSPTPTGSPSQSASPAGSSSPTGTANPG